MCDENLDIVVVERESTNIKVHAFTSCGHKHQHVIVWTYIDVVRCAITILTKSP